MDASGGPPGGPLPWRPTVFYWPDQENLKRKKEGKRRKSMYILHLCFYLELFGLIYIYLFLYGRRKKESRERGKKEILSRKKLHPERKLHV